AFGRGGGGRFRTHGLYPGALSRRRLLGPRKRKWLWILSSGDTVAASRFRRVKRAIGAREEAVGRLASAQRRNARGDRDAHARRECAPVELSDDGAEAVEDAEGRILGSIGQHQQKLLAAITAELVDGADVGEHGDGEGAQHLVSGRMAVGIVDALEKVEIDQRNRAGRVAPLGAKQLL